ncbi:OmpA family protein [Vibrio algarum]|uniref:OmpA family protein n=1 Tax=Vibrio algarum TaxID=3020714 RepID=A0ABT4YL08_9VIBR|nr:OmpA family protein [Vibrio sp. KJ40-1]MDB1122227.1 OmpA family protein [Vibrio sp. KJ40-1]
MKKLVMLASTLLVLSPQLVQAEAYVGGKIGYSWLDGECTLDNSCSDDGGAGGIYAGYNFTDMLGLEAGYDYLGDFDAAPFDDSMKVFTLAPKLTIPVNDFDFYAKLGAAWVDYDDIDDTVLVAAIGTEFGLSENVFGRFEYQRINNITEGIVENLDVNSLFFGLTYKFGSAAEPVAAMAVEEVIVEEEVVAVVEEPMPEVRLFQEYGVELFDNDSSKLAPNSEQYFDWLIGVMKKYPQAEAKIVGHTDSRGSAAYNQTLSEKRAQSVADYLFTQGIEESRVTVLGEGESKPKASNDTAEGRMENRRVEVIIDEFEIKQ